MITRTAIIGAGKAQATQTKLGGYQIGYTHAGAYQRNPQTHLVAVADIVPAHIDAFNDRFDTVGYADYRTMLTTLDASVNVGKAVYIALGHNLRSMEPPAMRQLWRNSVQWLLKR